MADELPPAPEPIEWLVYAQPQQIWFQIEAAAKSRDITSASSHAGPGASAGGTLRSISISGEEPFGVADCAIRGASEASSTVNIDPIQADRLSPSAPPLSWKAFERLRDAIADRFAKIGIEFYNLRAQGFGGPPPRPGSLIAISKPSERSMWAAPIFYERVFRKRDDLCFVIMPFRDAQLQFVEHAVKPVVTSLGLECKLANEFRGGHNDIVEEIWVALNEARFLIVDLTGQNPNVYNVYYELGIANTLGKQIIAIHKKGAPDEDARLPFDVRTRRTVFYEDTMAGGAAFQKELREHIEAILQSQA